MLYASVYFWGKACKWKYDDPRLSRTPTPSDMLLLGIIIREAITALAANYPNSSEVLEPHADA